MNVFFVERNFVGLNYKLPIWKYSQLGGFEKLHETFLHLQDSLESPIGTTGHSFISKNDEAKLNSFMIETYPKFSDVTIGQILSFDK